MKKLVLIITGLCVSQIAIAQQTRFRLAGIENEPASQLIATILSAAYQRINVATEIHWLPAERSIVLVDHGAFDADIMHPEEVATSYRQMVKVPTPLLHVEYVALSMQRQVENASWDNLRLKKVCIRRGIKLIEKRTREVKMLYSANQYVSVIHMLRAGRCDVAVLPRLAWLGLNEVDVSGVIEWSPALERVPLYHFIHRSLTEMVPKLDEQLRSSETKDQLGYLQRKLDLAQSIKKPVSIDRRDRYQE